MSDESIQLANNAAIRISEVLPKDTDAASWTEFSDILAQLHDAMIAGINKGVKEFSDLEPAVAQLVQQAGNLAGKANDGTLETEQDGPEIATVLNAAKLLPNHIAGVYQAAQNEPKRQNEPKKKKKKFRFF
jgi:hypothetical protein